VCVCVCVCVRERERERDTSLNIVTYNMTNFKEFEEAVTASCISTEPSHFTSSQTFKQPCTQHHVTL